MGYSAVLALPFIVSSYHGQVRLASTSTISTRLTGPLKVLRHHLSLPTCQISATDICPLTHSHLTIYSPISVLHNLIYPLGEKIKPN